MPRKAVSAGVTERIKRLIEGWMRENTDAYGGFSAHVPTMTINDGGGYSGELRPSRPAFIEEDEAGWER